MILIAPFREEQYPETTTTRCLKIYVPDDDSFLAMLASMINLLGNELNYVQTDDVLAAKHAQIWRDAYLLTDWLECDPPVDFPIGTILYKASASLPPLWLYANGDVQLRASYALLYDEITDIYGDVATLYPELENPELYFLLPNAKEKFIMGYSHGGGAYSFAEEGGSETHTLTTSEMPSHTHDAPVSGAASGSVGNTAGYASGIFLEPRLATQSTGGGTAHNNMPPYLAMNAIIYAGE